MEDGAIRRVLSQMAASPSSSTPSNSSDMLTTAKNVVSALSNLRNIYAGLMGDQASPEMSTATLVFSGQGRVVRISLTDGGSTDGYLYDSNLVTSLTNRIAKVNKLSEILELGIPVQRGLVYVPGTSQKAVVVFSQT